MASVPYDAISASVIVVSSAPVDCCTCVACATPLTLMTDADVKFSPVTFSWKPACPETTVSGAIDVIDGTGTDTTNGTSSEVTLPAFTT